MDHHRATETASASSGQETVPMLDLQPFCGCDLSRPYLMKPFSRDGFTWATNGHILLRVPLRLDVPDVDQQFNQAGPLSGFDRVTLWARLEGELPAEVPGEVCELCEGTGRDEEFDECSCVGCDGCDGKGRRRGELEMSITVDRIPYALNYIRLLCSLPQVEIGIGSADNQAFSGKPLLFRFAGGVGALMPISANREKHVAFLPNGEARSLQPDLSAAEITAVAR